MPRKKYNWNKLKVEFIKEYNGSLKSFILEKIGENGFKKNGNYKTHIREKVKTWTKDKENYWRDFMRDTTHIITPKEKYKYFQSISKLYNFLPELVDAYIKDINTRITLGKQINLNEIIKLFTFLKEFNNYNNFLGEGSLNLKDFLKDIQ